MDDDELITIGYGIKEDLSRRILNEEAVPLKLLEFYWKLINDLAVLERQNNTKREIH